jgi:hypothetical protein
MKNKTYYTIVQNFDQKDFELRQFREIVKPNELLADFHSFVPSMGISSRVIDTRLDYGFIISECLSEGHQKSRFDFNRLESALEFTFKVNTALYDGLNSRLVKAQKLNLRKALYSMPFMSDDKQQKYQHYLDTIAKLQEVVASKPEFFDFHKYDEVEFLNQ